MSNRVFQLIKVQDEARELFRKKNTDYGDAFATYGTVGVLMRMSDKLLRLQSITKSQVTLIDSEKIRDTLIDLHNYSAMAVMLLDENNNLQNNQANEVQTNEQQNNTKKQWEVASLTEKNKKYIVEQTDKGYSCDCLGFQYRQWCKHCEKINHENQNNNQSFINKKRYISKTNNSIVYTCVCKNNIYNCDCPGFYHRDWCSHCDNFKYLNNKYIKAT